MKKEKKYPSEKPGWKIEQLLLRVCGELSKINRLLEELKDK